MTLTTPTCQNNSKDRITMIYDMNSTSIYYCIHIFLFLPKWLPLRSDLPNEEKPAELEVWKLVLANSDAADYFGPGNTIMFRLRANPRKFRANTIQCQAGKIHKTFSVFKSWPDWLSLQKTVYFIFNRGYTVNYWTNMRCLITIKLNFEALQDLHFETVWNQVKSDPAISVKNLQPISFSPLLHYFLLIFFYLTEFCH